MVTKFLGKKEGMFDDVSYEYQIATSRREYIVDITFCGSINENGEEDLITSLWADISINQTKGIKGTDYTTLAKLRDKYKEQFPDIEYEQFSNGEWLSFKNESDFNSSVDDFKMVIKDLIGILIEADIEIVA